MQYIITVYPEDYIEYTITADDENEAWHKYHEGDYDSKEEDFTGFDWRTPKITLVDTDNQYRQIGA